jgi:hypothetical protein
MKVLNDNQIQAEVFSLLMKQLEPWKVAHFWAMCRFGTGDYLKTKYEQPDIESFEDLISDILDCQNHRL